jgi:hypothetical protein
MLPAHSPLIWRGLEIRTPYFAAIDFPQPRKPPLVRSALENRQHPRSESVDAYGMLAALRFYGIPGWSSGSGDK